MSGAEGLLAALGGGIIFVGAIWGLLRGIFKQTNATEENTKAIGSLTQKLDGLVATQNGHDRRIAILEDWRESIREDWRKPSHEQSTSHHN